MSNARGTFFVPFVTTAPPPPAPPADAPWEEHHRRSAAAHCPVLIVEDDADLREMMAQLLTLEGYGTATVSNGREALRYLHEGEVPKVILLDLMMPVMDGWEFRRRQQSDPDRKLADLPVIVLSALDQQRASNLEASAFLKKPLDFDRLLELVRQYCG
jgi:CheY-like chemotaxis protein